MEHKTIIDILNRLDAHTYNCMGKVIFGHEVWLENAVCDFASNIFSADLKYGHNMHSDGKVPEEYINISIFDNDGNLIESSIKDIPDGYRIIFKGNGNAPYTMYNESIPVIWNHINDGTWKAGVKCDFTNVKSSASYQMYAKIIFSQCELSRLEQTILEIIPDKNMPTTGEKISFKVLYEGKPVVGNEVKFYSNESKTEFFNETDSNGNVSFTADSPGEWMILVRFKDTNKLVENEFDETVYITTLVMRLKQ